MKFTKLIIVSDATKAHSIFVVKLECCHATQIRHSERDCLACSILHNFTMFKVNLHDIYSVSLQITISMLIF